MVSSALPRGEPVTHICVDLADPAAVSAALAPLTDITHVFYVAWAPHFFEEDQNREANSRMLRNVLSAVVPNCPALVHVSLQTGSKHYIGPPESIGKFTIETPFSEDMPRLDNCPNLYYDQEDALFDAVSRSRRRGAAVISWSVHRPFPRVRLLPAERHERGVHPLRVRGHLPQGGRQEAPVAGVARRVGRVQQRVRRGPRRGAAHLGGRRPGGEERGVQLQQRRRLQVEAAVDGARRQVRDGVVGVRGGGEQGEPDGGGIVREEGLVAAAELDQVANWWFVDALFMDKWEFLDTMNKSKEHGFLGFRNTVKSFGTWIDKLRLYKIVPSCRIGEPDGGGIVREEGLVAAAELDQVANWWFVDALFMDKWEFLDTMNKSKEHGFLGFRNTVKSFGTWIDKLRLYKIVPSCRIVSSL
ncbi:hypothetical protein OsJ_11316 [Oryza sativa Japonica Group]|uniref:PRISE-like Rossmann-fold domain-containing protein n=1 Tax=Oryza sativa subsp. japonica TaxID=39947 RepID=B9F932_ORYSJ|nr:hypothetical protein OsJ_11316 [Oryza sativa Japonica Group]